MLKMARLNRTWICLDLETGRVFTSRTVKGILAQLKARTEES